MDVGRDREGLVDLTPDQDRCRVERSEASCRQNRAYQERRLSVQQIHEQQKADGSQPRCQAGD